MPLTLTQAAAVLKGRRPQTATAVKALLDTYAQSKGYDFAPWFALADLVEAGIVAKGWARRAYARRAGILGRKKRG